VRGIGNTLCVGLVGGALAVLCYAAIAYGMREPHRPRDAAADALVAAPRIAAPLIFGLAILLVFFACRPLAHFQMTMVSIWLAYTLLWLTYGTQLVSHALARVSPALEDAARSMGAERKRVARDVTLPLLRHGLFAAWILIVLLFVREYAAGVLLFGSGTEVIGTLVVSLWRNGAIQLAAPLAMIHLAIIGIIVAVAFRFGVRPHG
jgi:iron(III) transport system permease protein